MADEGVKLGAAEEQEEKADEEVEEEVAENAEAGVGVAGCSEANADGGGWCSVASITRCSPSLEMRNSCCGCRVSEVRCGHAVDRAGREARQCFKQ